MYRCVFTLGLVPILTQFCSKSIGLYYMQADDILIVTLAEGSVIICADVSSNAHIEQNDSSENLSTIKLSKRIRQLTQNAEGRTFDSTEYARIHALCFSSIGDHVIWVQE